MDNSEPYDDSYWASQLEILTAMSDGERDLHFLAETGRDEKAVMAGLIYQYQWCRDTVERLKRMAKDAVIDYNEGNSEDDLVRIEQCTQMIETFSTFKVELREEIRVSRERVRWYRKKYRQMMQEQQRS